MSYNVQELHGRPVVFFPSAGLLLRTCWDATDLIGEVRSADASTAVVPLERIDPAFFELRTGVAEVRQLWRHARRPRRHESPGRTK